MNSYLPSTGGGTLPVSLLHFKMVQLSKNKKQKTPCHTIPCHPLHAPFPRQPWQMHHWPKYKRSHLCLYSSILQLVPQNQGGESERERIKTFWGSDSHCDAMSAQGAASRNEDSTLEQPGVKAPGTAKRIPFFSLKSWSMATLFPGSPSWTSTTGSVWPTCWNINSIFKSKKNSADMFISKVKSIEETHKPHINHGRKRSSYLQQWLLCG